MNHRGPLLCLIYVLALSWNEPASACFEWCFGWWSWGNAQSHSVDPRPLLDNTDDYILSIAPLEDQTLTDADDEIVMPYGIKQAEIRKAYDIGFPVDMFDSAQARDDAFELWKPTIGRSETNERYRFYEYRESNLRYILASLDHNGTLSFAIRENRNTGTSDTARPGTTGNAALSLFSRAYVTLGGATAVKRIEATWPEHSADGRQFASSMEELGSLAAANQTTTGIIADRFYNMSARSWEDNEESASRYSVIFGPADAR